MKPLRFREDITWRLMQWIEMVKILGADRVELYVDDVHENVERLLGWYSGKGVSARRHKNVESIVEGDDGERTWQKRRSELLAYNDCLYRNLNEVEFVVPVDIDEVVVPRVHRSWKGLLEVVASEDYASFMVSERNTKNKTTLPPFSRPQAPNAYYFTASDPDEPVFFTHLLRTPLSPAGESGKSFVRTDAALTVFNHYALHVLRPGVGRCQFLPGNLVQMNHYKTNCSREAPRRCWEFLEEGARVKDGVIFKYKEEFEGRYGRAKAEFLEFCGGVNKDF